MSYQPERYGCRCDECPLREVREGGPVPAEWPATATALLVGEAPGADEVKRGAPFVGRAGIELTNGLRAVGVARNQVALTNVVLCRPPENAYDRIVHQVQKENKRRAAEGLDPIPTPAECCRPRLLRELAALPKVIALGGVAYKAAVGQGSIMAQRGGPREVTIAGEPSMKPGASFGIRVLPTLHPSFVMRSRRWRGAFHADLARAFRWFSSGLAWREPEAIYAPRPAELHAFLASIRNEPLSVFDVETFAGFQAQEHFEPMEDRLKCIGIGVASGRAAVVPFRSVEPNGGGWYTRDEQREIVSLLRRYLESPKFPKGGWNSRYYDAMVIKHRLGVVAQNHTDGISIHRVAEPEMPHNLGYTGSVRTDVDKWKAGHAGTKAASDRELWEYNVKDTIVTAMAIPALRKVAKDRAQDHLIPVFERLQDICLGLHENGIPVDQAKRREWDRKLLGQANAHREKIRVLTGDSKLNPASFPQIADLLFERMKIAPHHYTDLGDPSTDDDALRAFLSETWGLDPKQRALVSAIRDFRRVTKRRGVVVRLRPITEDYYEGDDLLDTSAAGESFEERAERVEEEQRRRTKGKQRAAGLVLPDGRVHADWNSSGTTGWRFSSSKPNMQNVEDKLRDMFIAPPGFVFIGCDQAQLELRMVAGLAGCKYYVDAFAAKADPHKNLCIDVFGKRFLDAAPDHQKKLRRSVKELTYSSLYAAEDKTKWEIITSAEDEDETLLFPDFTLREVAAFSSAWFKRCPEIPLWWDALVAEQARQGFLAEPIMGLKCDFLDGPGSEGFLNRLANYKPQSGGAGIVHLATFRMLETLPFQKWGPGTSLIHQGHDALVLQVPCDHEVWRPGEKIDRQFGFCEPGCKCLASRVARFVEECMTIDGRQYGLDVDFFGEAHIGKTLKEA